jgi:hypothetical protein
VYFVMTNQQTCTYSADNFWLTYIYRSFMYAVFLLHSFWMQSQQHLRPSRNVLAAQGHMNSFNNSLFVNMCLLVYDFSPFR